MTVESLGKALGIAEYPLTWGFAARKMLHIHHGGTSQRQKQGASSLEPKV